MGLLGCTPTRQLTGGYWDGQILAAREEGFRGEAFTVYRVVIQGDPFSTTIFNVVVDVLVQHYLTQACGRQTTEQDLVMDIFQKGIIFYVYYEWLFTMDGVWLQESFDDLAGYFEWVVLQENADKTKRLVPYFGVWCWPIFRQAGEEFFTTSIR